jgi:hypothetical protein
MSSQRLTAVLFTSLATLATIAPAYAVQQVEIFNGKDLFGWSKRGGKATFDVENGEIVGRSVPNTSNTFLTTDKEYGDFVFEVEFKIDDPEFNSGIQIRSHARKDADQERVYGYQIEIDPRPDRAWTAGIYYEGGMLREGYEANQIKEEDWTRKAGWLDDLKDNEAARKAFKLGEWNKILIRAEGRNIKTSLNGVPAADFTDEDDKAFSPTGFIALQVHSVGGAQEPKEVRWRNLKLIVLD